MKAAAAQIAFRYRPQDSATGVTRTTTKRLADVLGVDETGNPPDNPKAREVEFGGFKHEVRGG